jgi:hypothetical protein
MTSNPKTTALVETSDNTSEAEDTAEVVGSAHSERTWGGPLPIPIVAWPPHVSQMHKRAIAYLTSCLTRAADDGSAERVELLARHAPTLRSWNRKDFVTILRNCGFFARKIRGAIEYLESQGEATDDAPVPETEVYVRRRPKTSADE